MKKLIAIGAMALVMTTCSTSAVGAMNQASTVAPEQKQVRIESPKVLAPVKMDKVLTGPTLRSEAPAVGSMDWMVEEKKKQDALEDEVARLEQIADNTAKLNKVIGQLKSRVHKTWYVFSGATPDGWDCSGLTMWAYGQLGIVLEHRASKQTEAGEVVETPKLGDIVVFTYKGNKSAYHVGIYTGPNEMVHAGGGKGESTALASISKFAGGHSKVTYVRLIETNH